MKNRVRLYGFEGCPYCLELKNLLDKNNIDYYYIDIYDDKFKNEVDKIMTIGKTESVPIVLVKGRILSPEISFNTIEGALELIIRFLNE